MIKKNPKADLRSKHTLFIEVGIICSLLFMIAATNMNIESKIVPTPDPLPGPDIIVIDIPPVIPPDTPPPPMKPSVFNVLPQDSPIEPDPIEFQEFMISDSLPIPPKPIVRMQEDIIVSAEFMPVMKGGIDKLYSMINYPENAIKVGIEGRVVVQFIVNKKGEVEEPVILRGIGGGCDEEVLRIIKLMKFTPGIQNGNFVRVKMAQTVTFKLQN